MKKFSGFSAALLIVFLSHMLWAQERGGQPMAGHRREAWGMSRELAAGISRSTAPLR